MYNCITNFTHNSTLKSKKLSRSKSRIKIYNSTELGTKRKKKECMSQRLNDLARPNVRRIRSIFEKQKKKSKFDMIKAEKLLKLMNEPTKKPFDVKICIKELTAKNKQERVAHSGDKAYDKCRQYCDFQCLTDKKVLLENQKFPCKFRVIGNSVQGLTSLFIVFLQITIPSSHKKIQLTITKKLTKISYPKK